MVYKLIILSVIIAVVAAEPLSRFSAKSDLDTSDGSQENQQLSRVLPGVSSLILDIVNALVGVKFTALTLGVFVIEWLVANLVVIILGAAAAVGFCKFTGKCHLNYEEYEPVSQFRNFVTPENLETAEQFFISAVEKYAEKKRQSI